MQENNREISAIKQRFFQYLKYKGISKYRCYQETGIANSVLSQKNGFSEDSFIRIAKTYPDLDFIWLILGDGDMIVEKYNIIEKPQNSIVVNEVTPDFMLQRFEDLVIENYSLKAELKQYKETTRGDYTMQNVPDLKVAESQTELDK